MAAVADLHLHTTASDGRLSPARLVQLLAAKGVRYAAITDHDSTEGIAEAQAEAANFPGLTIIPGIELSTDTPEGEIHVLGLFLDWQAPQLQRALERFREDRVLRAHRMVEKLNDLGVHIQWERVRQIAGGAAIGRPHIALAMVEKGYVSLPKEAFDRYISREGPAYV
ncbi:MAG: PHP domain-containing protein, partial [Chloroflexi bacterium]|nr:PHP domain-containing protein [Chloroflexota bacterium]